ncbi:envelope stress response membrane protein PspC [Candidatus Sumerlaeota bacterium]|nr:envelope stress response membrane protein PspC [Candidatus Sumerlaeota bacterium]
MSRNRERSFFGRRGRLYRSRKEAVFAGVCGGIAEHFDFSPWAVRLFVILMTFPFFFWTVVGYVLLAVLLKKEPKHEFKRYEDEEFYNVYQTSRSEALRKVNRAFEALDKRLQRMESIVTDPSFSTEDEYRNL